MIITFPIKIGQRWKYENCGIVEITGFAKDLSSYQATIIQVFNRGWTASELGYKWKQLPGWHDNFVFNGWKYLIGQDKVCE
jgi:hypothetical protein